MTITALFVTVSVLLLFAMLFLLLYTIVINVLAFALFRSDKRRAVDNAYRVPEAVLLALAFLGGAWGAFCAMCAFRHKTQHRSFVIAVPLALLLYLALFVFFFLRFLRP